MAAESALPPGLLHNMSVRPSTTISHPGAGLAGRGVLFTLSSAGCVEGGAFTARQMLGWLGIEETTPRAPARLRRLLNEHAATLPFPSACPVTDQVRVASETCADLLTVMSVLAKSSGHVYLRDKEPGLSLITFNRAVVLVVPLNWGPEPC